MTVLSYLHATFIKYMGNQKITLINQTSATVITISHLCTPTKFILFIIKSKYYKQIIAVGK